jgi:hypothetical protein
VPKFHTLETKMAKISHTKIKQPSFGEVLLYYGQYMYLFTQQLYIINNTDKTLITCLLIFLFSIGNWWIHVYTHTSQTLSITVIHVYTHTSQTEVNYCDTCKYTHKSNWKVFTMSNRWLGWQERNYRKTLITCLLIFLFSIGNWWYLTFWWYLIFEDIWHFVDWINFIGIAWFLSMYFIYR